FSSTTMNFPNLQPQFIQFPRVQVATAAGRCLLSMTANGKQEQLRLGFLTAIEVPDKGFIGGLLVTNHCGRPLEFQCTVPVKANATQEILYGPTLAPFILGELIGGTLVEKAGVRPLWILTD